MSFEIIDTHIHLASSSLSNDWADNDLNSDAKSMHPIMAKEVSRCAGDLTLQSLVNEIAEIENINVQRMVFVECNNDQGSIEEAKWVLDMAKDPNLPVCAVVAHIPVPEGEEAVRNYLSSIVSWHSTSATSTSSTSTTTLPQSLRGGRVVLLGNPMPPADACLSDKYDAGLSVLEEYGLHWEWCCHSSALLHIAKVCNKHPNMTFVLNHLGRNGGTLFEKSNFKLCIFMLFILIFCFLFFFYVIL